MIVRLTRERNGVALAAYFAGGLVIALYLRTGRFYSFAYLELAFLAAVAFMMILRITVFQRALAAALVVIIFLVGEVVPAPASWTPPAR